VVVVVLAVLIVVGLALLFVAEAVGRLVRRVKRSVSGTR